MQENKIDADFVFIGKLEAHSDWVTSIVVGAASNESADDEDAFVISGSRDKSLMIWKIYPEEDVTDQKAGEPLKKLTGHNHFVSDLTISDDNGYVISSSWDGTLRLWNLQNGACCKKFVGHDSKVFSCAFSKDNRQIFSAGSDKMMKLWNTRAECKINSTEVAKQHGHKDWISVIRYSQLNNKNSFYATVGWDGFLKIWTNVFQLKASIKAHEGNINALAISPNNLVICTGGKDCVARLWNYASLQDPPTELKCDSIINGIAFNNKYQWVAIATDLGVKVLDLTSEQELIICSIKISHDDEKSKTPPQCLCICWSANGRKLYVGCSDKYIRVYKITTRGA